jgi:FG-GAP-like repeat
MWRALRLLCTLLLGIGLIPPRILQVQTASAASSIFAFPSFLSSAQNILNVALGDLDGDGSLDIAGSDGQIYLNDGHGNYGAPVTLPGADPITLSGDRRLAVGDINADGRLDIILGDGKAYLNGGNADFRTQIVLPSVFSTSYSNIRLGNMNGDGTLDLVLANWSQPSHMYLNDGAGQFAAPIAIPNSGNGTTSIAAGDLNGDGALDLILTNFAQPNQIYLNNGAGSFIAPTLLPESGNNPSSIVIGDLNGDSVLDLVIGNNAAFQTSLVSLNDGTGHFNAPTILKQSNSRVFGAAIGDLNGDGRADVILADHNVGGQVYLHAHR